MNEFKLFVSGDTVGARIIVGHLHSMLTKLFSERYTLTVIDVLENPSEAQNDGIFATPSFVKMSPPKRKILGDFTNLEIVFQKLGIASSQ